jgi:mannitol-1-phosphate 5-dehydrogenase
MRSAVQFGAGNIGRGFLAQLFHESGLEVVFVDVVQPVIKAINEAGTYTIHIVGDSPSDVNIDHIRAIDARDIQSAAEAVAAAEVVCTAVGVAHLLKTAPAIAQGLVLRYQRGTNAPLNILLCENLHNAAEVLKEAVEALLPSDICASILGSTGFVQTVVGRMVPAPTEAERAADPLGIRVEAYKNLPADSQAWVGPHPGYVGVKLVSPFQAYVDRKLFTHNCAHAVIGYAGWEAGLEFGWQALENPTIEALLQAVMRETGEALIRKHGLDPAEHASHVAGLLQRFKNRDLGDTCIRLARDPVRKLAPGDRIVGAARCCQEQGVVPQALAAAIGSALRYNGPEDPSASLLQADIAALGIGAVLEKYCGISAEEPLAAKVIEAYTTGLGALRA